MSWLLNEQRLFVLIFHGIGHPVRRLWPGEERVWVEQQFFEAVLNELRGRNDILLTFDDGNISDFETALPALQARGMKAHFYIVSDLIGQTGFLSASNIRELRAADMVIGNHGKFHRSWRELTDQELHEELVAARDHLQQIISDAVRFAACPYGEYDRRILERLRIYDYERVYTSDGGPAHGSAWLQPRNSLRRNSAIEGVRRLLESTMFTPTGLMRICRRTIKRWR